MKDGLKNLNFKDNGNSDFIKFRDGEVVKLRVFTTDPVIHHNTYTSPSGEETVTTKYAFAVYNYGEQRPMILDASPSIAKGIYTLHTDEDYGEDVTKIDIKITPTGEMLERRYAINVLPNTQTLEKAVEEALEVLDGKLDSIMKNGLRASDMNDGQELPQPEEPKPSKTPKKDDIVIEDIGDEPINLDDIPF